MMELTQAAYEQETQSWFTTSDEMNALDVKINIEDSDHETWPDCVFITPEADPYSVVTLSPTCALELLLWLEFHKERLMRAARREMASHVPNATPENLQAILDAHERNLRTPLEVQAMPFRRCYYGDCGASVSGRTAEGEWCCADHQHTTQAERDAYEQAQLAEFRASQQRKEQYIEERENDRWDDIDSTPPDPNWQPKPNPPQNLPWFPPANFKP